MVPGFAPSGTRACWWLHALRPAGPSVPAALCVSARAAHPMSCRRVPTLALFPPPPPTSAGAHGEDELRFQCALADPCNERRIIDLRPRALAARNCVCPCTCVQDGREGRACREGRATLSEQQRGSEHVATVRPGELYLGECRSLGRLSTRRRRRWPAPVRLGSLLPSLARRR